MTTVTELTVLNSDDGFTRAEYYYTDYTTVYNPGFSSGLTVTKVGYDSGAETMGVERWFRPFFHFTSVAIPVGATITAATLSVRHASSGSTSYSGETLDVSAEDEDSPARPTESYSPPYDGIDDTLTTAKATWTLGAMVDGTWYESPDISAVIQELVDRGGWASGNDINMFLHNASTGGNWNARWYAHDQGTGYEPKLEITYTEPDTTAPTVTSLSPADDTTGVVVTTDLVINFSENVQAGSGNIVIKKSSDDSTTHTIPVASGQVSGSTVTINPSSDFDAETGYYVQIDSGAFEDLSANDYAGISDNTTWNFTTEESAEETNTPRSFSLIAGGAMGTSFSLVGEDDTPPKVRI